MNDSNTTQGTGQPGDGYNDATRPYVFKPGEKVSLGLKRPWALALGIYVIGFFGLCFFIAVTTLGWGLLAIVAYYPLWLLIALALFVMTVIETVRLAKKR